MWRLHVPHFQGNINYAKVLSEHEHPFTAFNTTFYIKGKLTPEVAQWDGTKTKIAQAG